MNKKIINHYSLELIPLQVQPVDIDEIDYTLIPGLIKELESDFKQAELDEDEPLEILDTEEVFQTIENTVEKCLEFSLR